MFENNEKYDMLKCFWECNEDAQAAGNLYFIRYPERRQPFRDIFSRLQNNIIRYGSFTKPRPKTYNAQTRDRELEEITILGEIENQSNRSLRNMERETGLPKTSVLRILKKIGLNHIEPEKFIIFLQMTFNKD